MFILLSMSSGIEFWSVNDISIYVYFEANVFKNMKKCLIIDQTLYTNVYKTLEFCWKLFLFWTTLHLSNIPSNEVHFYHIFIVSGVKGSR